MKDTVMMTNKQLLSELFDTIPSRLAVLGMAKNAGKTVTLNRILAWAADQTSIFGITSIGRDGEPEDVLTKTKKPAITLYPGMLFATGEQWLKNATLTYELLEHTAIQTYFGTIVIGRVTQKGEIQVSGANTNAEHERVMQRLEANGASRVLVDGAMLYSGDRCCTQPYRKACHLTDETSGDAADDRESIRCYLQCLRSCTSKCAGRRCRSWF
jgi:hypothetical protein